jgi:hypothetical protein
MKIELTNIKVKFTATKLEKDLKQDQAEMKRLIQLLTNNNFKVVRTRPKFLKAGDVITGVFGHSREMMAVKYWRIYSITLRNRTYRICLETISGEGAPTQGNYALGWKFYLSITSQCYGRTFYNKVELPK